LPEAAKVDMEKPPPVKHWLTKKIKITIVFSVTVALGMTVYILWPQPPAAASFAIVSHHGKCMYWAGDHFITGSYDTPHHDTPAFPVDTFRLANFKN
jgi:hypothetical protein